LPAGASALALASASDNLCDAYRAVASHLRSNPGAPVLVVGGLAQSIGLYAANLAVALGSSQVDYVDHNRARLAVAEQLGAAAIESPRPGRRFGAWPRGRPGGYPITVDASSRPAGLDFAIRALAPGGTCTATGFYFRRGTPVPLWNMYLTSASLVVGVSHPRAVLPELLQLVGNPAFLPERVTSLVADWDDAPRALLEKTIKVVVRRQPLYAKTG
jgi:alcohol dehydrogenase